MTIPQISRRNVFTALQQIDRDGVPRSRQSTRYYLVHEGRRYPPKYVVSLAVQDLMGQALDPQEFSGGVETNSLLRALGFSVVAFSADAVDRAGTGPRSARRPSSRDQTSDQAEAEPVSSRTGDQESLLGRVVVCGQPPGNATDGESMLLDVLTNRWPRGLHLKFLITPGGFVRAPFPCKWRGGVSWDSKPGDLKALARRAEDVLSKTVTEKVRKAAEGKIDVLTVGIDLASDHCSEHAELVAVCELSSRRVFWTGKSYPTTDQERDLVQVVDLNSHLLTVAGERVLVLGCHDLNMYSPRSRANLAQGGRRWKRCEEMRRLTRRFRPTIVLHHPHSTDSPNIWRTAWSTLRQMRGVRAWASGIAWYHRQGSRRGPLDKVLAATQGGRPAVDFKVSVR